jgi:hypothetical protein
MLKYRGYLAGIVVAYFGAAILFWLYGDPAMVGIFERAQGVPPVWGPWLHQPYAHAPLPFIDLVGIFSWRECYLQGIDVTLHNPCDIIPRGPANYSPVVWHLPTEWLGLRNPIPAAIALNSVFLAIVIFLFEPRSYRDLAIAALAILSPPVFYAVERTNLDLVIFILAVGAICLPQRKILSRLVFYICAVASGLLKLYPFALLIALVREPIRRFLVLSILSLAVIGVFLSDHWAFITHLVLPRERTSGMFGGKLFASGLQELFGLTDTGRAVFYVSCCLVSAAISILIAARVKDDPKFRDGLDRASSLVLCGGILVLGCFFSGLSIYYRAIFLLPVLAGLLSLRLSFNNTAMQKLIRLAVPVTMLCLYGDRMRALGMAFLRPGLIEPSSVYGVGFATVILVVKELFWWSEITILAGIVLAYLIHFPVGLEFFNLPVFRKGNSPGHKAAVSAGT